MLANTKRVTLARAYTDAKGRTYQADETVTLPYAEAANLLWLGHARQPDKPETAPEAEDGARRGKRHKDKEGA